MNSKGSAIAWAPERLRTSSGDGFSVYRPRSRERTPATGTHDLAFRQFEVSETLVFDQLQAGRAWFEGVIRDHLDVGRPDQVALIFDRRKAYILSWPQIAMERNALHNTPQADISLLATIEERLSPLLGGEQRSTHRLDSLVLHSDLIDYDDTGDIGTGYSLPPGYTRARYYQHVDGVTFHPDRGWSIAIGANTRSGYVCLPSSELGWSWYTPAHCRSPPWSLYDADFGTPVVTERSYHSALDGFLRAGFSKPMGGEYAIRFFGGRPYQGLSIVSSWISPSTKILSVMAKHTLETTWGPRIPD